MNNPLSDVKSVLVVLSSGAQAFDLSGLRKLVTIAFPGAAVFFISTSGDPVGVEGPYQVDLVIDFTKPHARQALFFAKKMRKRGRIVVGRAAGWFYRRKRYDRIFEELSHADRPVDFNDAEAWAQRKTLELAGVPIVHQGGVTPDRSKEIAQELS